MVGRKTGTRFPNRIKILAGRAMVYMKDGSVALVNPEDVPMIRDHTWHSDGGYAKSSRKCPDTGKCLKSKMHRLIAQPSGDLVVDHRNGNRMDNRRCNLRVVTASDNAKNRRPSKQGIEFHANCPNRPYAAFIRVNKKAIRLGNFATHAEALEARIAAQRHYFGEMSPV